MKTILILGNSIGGLYNFRLELIRELSQKYNLHVSCPENDDHHIELLEKEGITYHPISMDRRSVNPFLDFSTILNYKKLFKSIKPDIVLTYTIKPNLYGNIISRLFKIPVISNITGLGSAIQTSNKKRIFINLYKIAFKKTNVVFFQNEVNKKLFIEEDIINNARSILIPGSGVNLDRFPMKTLKKPENKIRFLFIGRIMREKGIIEYLEVSKIISEKYENVEFIITGRYQEEDLRELVENYSSVNYIGSTKSVSSLLESIDVVINPSYHEGMSNVLLEAAATGRALIASDIPGCREIIDNEKNGFVFPKMNVEALVDRVEQYLNLDEIEKENMRKYSRMKVEKEFDRNIVIDKYDEVIQDILGEN